MVLNAGHADTAGELTSSAGDANTPVYFNNGKPVACTGLDLNTTGSSASCTGNAATASKLAEAKTITLNGDVSGSGSFDGSNNLTITTAVADNSHNHTGLKPIKRCIVGQTTESSTNPWYQVGYCKLTGGAHLDRTISFKISQGYADNSTYLGILTAHIRTGSSNQFENGQLVWEYANGSVVLTDWVLGYKTAADGFLEASLWACQDSQWALFHLEVLSEHDRTDWTTDWTLYTVKSAGQYASIPTEWTQIVSNYSTIHGDKIYGAVYNDYAEYRETDVEDFGYVLTENGDDTLSKTTERLQHFAGISSDTWGFSQGETEKAKTPIAVAGRVLAYPYQDRNNYKPGDCVCAAPGGLVDIMTREEVINYPDRIVGTVSCVPNYEEWGGGPDRGPVKIDGRIWIKVR